MEGGKIRKMSHKEQIEVLEGDRKDVKKVKEEEWQERIDKVCIPFNKDK